MTSIAKDFLAYFGLIAAIAWGFCGALLAGILVDGLVLQVLWGWFVEPTFGLQPLTVPVAAGLATIACLLKGTGVSPRTSNEDKDGHGRAAAAQLERAASILDAFVDDDSAAAEIERLNRQASWDRKRGGPAR